MLWHPAFTETNMVATVPEKVVEAMKASIPMQRLGKTRRHRQCLFYFSLE